MDVLYVSCLCSPRVFQELFQLARMKPPQQVQKYHRLMTDGLSRNEDISVEVMSAVPGSVSFTERLYFPREIDFDHGIKYDHLPFVNIPVFRHLGLFVSSLVTTYRWCQNTQNGLIICDILDISISAASLLVSKLTKTHCLGIVTDIPGSIPLVKGHRMSLMAKIIATINTFTMRRFDSYVFLTEQMNGLINSQNRPYIVLEGQVDINMTDVKNELIDKYEHRVCLYAGAINKIYGIKMLTDAFVALGIEGVELHIYGSGDFEDELKTICQEHPNIKYFGVVPNQSVVCEQLKASLLINPRPTSEEYTKYSFPSKNLEYMASGTATLTTNLPGMPAEYKQYVYILEHETTESLVKQLEFVLSKSKEELHLKGIQAKEYVIKEKNNVVQTAKIINMIRSLNK